MLGALPAVLPCPASTEVELVTTDLEIGVQVDPGPHRNCSRCGQPCNVEVCAACARDPLSSNQRVQRYDMVEKVRGMEAWHELERADDGDWCRYEDVQAEIERLNALWECEHATVMRLAHDLDNERSAMRNVQECAESYRRERDWLIEERAKESRADALVVLERDRLRAALHEARHVMRWEMGYQDGGRNIANADKVCVKIDSLIGAADETKP